MTDDSGSVYVYGVLSTKGGEKKKFQELVEKYGIANGGTITIKANRGSYQGKDEALNAYFVSYNGQGSDTPGGGGEQQGNVVTFDLTAQGYENAQDFTGLAAGDISISVDKGDNKNGPKFYTSGNAVRFYGGNSLTVKSSGKNIVKIELSFGSGDPTNEITTDPGTWNSPNWTGSASSVKFTVGGTSGHRRIAKLVVTLAE